MPAALKVHLESGVLGFELASEDSYPRLHTALLNRLDMELQRGLADPACAGIVIHGSDQCFAAGAEIGELAGLGGAEAMVFARRGQLLFEKIAAAAKPVVAAIAGYCLGGGLDLALACHRRLATPHAVLGHPGATLGLLTGWGGTQRLPRIVGRAAALELLLRGEPLKAEEALRLGLIDEIVAPEGLVARAADRARQLVLCTPY